MTIKILIGADICPTKSNYDLFSKGDINSLLGDELTALLQTADYTVFNLQTPPTDILSEVGKNMARLPSVRYAFNKKLHYEAYEL